jgi:poly(3-hydroxybutyrate) depolymerase
MKHAHAVVAVTLAATAVALAGSAPTASAAGSGCTLSATGGTITRTLGARSYLLHVPAGLRGTAVPLLLSLHGAGSDGSQDELFTGWSGFADTHEFIVAYPNAMSDPEHPSVPYLGGGVWDPYTVGSPDVPFLAQVVRDIASRYCVDPSRVYVDGWSNGAVMSERAACDAAGVFAAANSYGGGDPTVWADSGLPAGRYSGEPCKPSRPISVSMITGQEDFTYGGLAENASLWRGIDHCSQSPTGESDSYGSSSTYACAGGTEVVARVVNDTSHNWPSGAQGEDQRGRIWSFFAANPLPADRNAVVRGAVRAHRRRRSRRTWYVRAAAKHAGKGSRGAPFRSLQAVERVSRPGDRIVILPSPLRVPPLGGGIALKRRQTLVGAGPSVLRHGLRALPRIENTDRSRSSGDAVELSRGDTVKNLVIGPSYRGGIYGSDVNSATIAGNDLSATNSSCTTGFVVQPFTLPSLVPGAGVPFSSGLPNGWAAIMIDGSRAHARLRIARNFVHDAGCADGIDIRASGTAQLTASVKGNVLTRLHEGASQQSVLAIGMQTVGHAGLNADLSRNTESYIGNATLGDEGFADSEGLFANSAGPSRLTEHVEHNTFAHGLGHLSANCFEVVSSSGGPTMNVSLAHSTCDHVVGDVLEAVNLSKSATMNFTAEHVRAADSEFVAGPAFHQVEPGDDGDCLFELAAGAASTTTVKVTHSVLTGCVTDGLEVASSVDDGTGPVKRLSFDVRDSSITGNRLSNLRVANSSPVAELDGRIEHTDLAGTPGTPIILEDIDRTGGTHARLDFGGGPLGSAGANCIDSANLPYIEDVRDSASARGDWWGQATGPPPGGIVATGGSVDSGQPLRGPPAGVC